MNTLVVSLIVGNIKRDLEREEIFVLIYSSAFKNTIINEEKE